MMIGNKVEIKFTKSPINSLLSSRRVYMSSLINFPYRININFSSPGMIGNMVNISVTYSICSVTYI